MTRTQWERMATGVVPGLQSRCGAPRCPGWVRFPHVPAIFSIGLILLVAPGIWGQTPDTAVVKSRPMQETPAEAADTLPPVTALGAFGRSLILPGWGQTALDRPLRGAIYFTAEAATLFMLIRSQARLNAAKRAEPADEALVSSRTGQREDWIVLAVFWAFVSGLDGWVSAHLWDFEAVVEPPEESGLGAMIEIRIPVGLP